jgi:hypothetical protein
VIGPTASETVRLTQQSNALARAAIFFAHGSLILSLLLAILFTSPPYTQPSFGVIS